MKTQNTLFQDRRNTERRQHNISSAIPVTGCRRQQDRRNRQQQFDPRPWWLKARYVDEHASGNTPIHNDQASKKSLTFQK